MPTAKNGFHILNQHPKKYVFKKILFFNANLLENFQYLSCKFSIFSRKDVLIRDNISEND